MGIAGFEFVSMTKVSSTEIKVVSVLEPIVTCS